MVDNRKDNNHCGQSIRVNLVPQPDRCRHIHLVYTPAHEPPTVMAINIILAISYHVQFALSRYSATVKYHLINTMGAFSFLRQRANFAPLQSRNYCTKQ